MAKKGQKLSKSHKKAISDAAKKRHAQKSRETPSEPTKRIRRRVVKNGRAPTGIRVLTRHGSGKDVVECNANEVIEALRIMRLVKKILA